MALYDRNDLVARLQFRISRPASDEAFTVATTNDGYDLCLTEAQSRLNQLLGIYVPDAIWTVPTLLTSSDGGKTWGFGTDTDGAAIFAFGHFEVYESKSSIPNLPMTEGIDFAVQGAILRIPDDNARTFSDGPYAQFAAPSNVIDGTHEPVVPKIARPALLSEAEIRCWKRLGLDSSRAEAQFDQDWNELLTAVRTQSMAKGGQPILRRPRSYLLPGRRY